MDIYINDSIVELTETLPRKAMIHPYWHGNSIWKYFFIGIQVQIKSHCSKNKNDKL